MKPIRRVRSPRRFRRYSRHGFTLIELIISMVSATVLMTGIALTLFIAVQGFNGNSSAVDQLAAADVMSDMMLDLNEAIEFSQRTSNAVEFTVPDRDDDSNPETIRYAWSGTPGAPLTYQYNGGPPANLALDVQQFDLTYLLRTMGPPPPVESDEVLLIAHDYAGGDLKDYEIKHDKFNGQYFFPLLAPGTVSWKITRVQFVAEQKDDPTETLEVQITTADGELKPTLTVIDNTFVAESALAESMAWFEVTFADADGLDPSQGYCLVFKGNATRTCKIQREEDGAPMTGDTHWMKNEGSWTDPDPNIDLQFKVYGTYTAPPP